MISFTRSGLPSHLSPLPAMAQTDIIQWANYIRSSMAFDPGRQHFDDHIQKHGFDFLDNYLDSILAKTKEEYVCFSGLRTSLLIVSLSDVVDLLKTPGRKKTSKSKSVLPSSKLKNIISLEVCLGQACYILHSHCNRKTERRRTPHYSTAFRGRCCRPRQKTNCLIHLPTHSSRQMQFS